MLARRARSLVQVALDCQLLLLSVAVVKTCTMVLRQETLVTDYMLVDLVAGD